MIYNSFVQEEENIKSIPEELIQKLDVVKSKPIDGKYEKYKEEFSYHKVEDDLKDWVKHEFRSALLPDRTKVYYFVGTNMDKFLDWNIQEMYFYPVQFEDNQWRFWSQWYENERIEETRRIKDDEAELCKFKFKPEPGKWYRMKVDEIFDLETKTPVMGIVAYD